MLFWVLFMLFNNICLFLLVAVVSYLLGSFNSAIVVTKFFCVKEDIRNLGSGNAGFTNVLRTVGILPAALTFLGDLLKSFVALVFSHIAVRAVLCNSGEQFSSVNKSFVGFIFSVVSLVCGIFLILGHVYPCFFQFKGGKAVTCLLPITLFFDFRVSLLSVGVFLLILFFSRIMSLASIVGTLSLPVFNFFLGLIEKKEFKYVSITTILLLLITMLILYKHSGNIERIKNHTERKINIAKK